MKRLGRGAHWALGIALAAVVAGCGGGGGGVVQPPPVITISASAAAPMVAAGMTDMITATVTENSGNSPLLSANWSVSCTAAQCGSVSPTTTSSGQPTTYTAPSTIPAGNLMVTITATAAADMSKQFPVVVTVPGITVTAMAASAVVSPGAGMIAAGTTTVTSNVTGDTPNMGINWSVSCTAPDCGKVLPAMTPDGGMTTYTGPANPPAGNMDVTVTATSITNNGAAGSAKVTIPGIMVAVAPSGPVTLQSGAMQPFMATVNQDPSSSGVNWSLRYFYQTRVCTIRFNCHLVNHTGICVTCGFVSAASTPSGGPLTYTAPPRPPSFGFGALNIRLSLVASSVTTGAAQGTVAILILPISVSVSPSTSTFTTFSGMQQFTATVTNDGTNQGVHWSLTQNGTACSPGCGTLSVMSSPSGTPITYTGPASAPVSPTVTLAAKSVEDSTKSNSATVTVPVISVAINPGSASAAVGTMPQFTATVTNDVSNAGVAWTLTQGGNACSPACGMVTANTPSGAPATYTAPATVPALPAVTLIATSVADGTKTATATITITTASGAACGAGSGSESLLKGQYAFELEGFYAGGTASVAMAGGFTADGTGKITAGERDINLSGAGFGINVNINAVDSSYAVGPDHRGCLILTDANGTTYFRFALGALNATNIATVGKIIEFDDVNGMGTRVAGALRLQDPTSFVAGQFKGNYAVGFVGGHALGRFASAGTFTSDGVSSIPTGNFDTDIGGMLFNNDPLSGAGSYTCCSTNGRGTLQLPTNGLGSFAFYMVNSGDVFLVGVGPGPYNGEAIGIPSGTAFNAASLKGVGVLRQTAQPAAGSRVDISLATADGVSSLALTQFENNAGTFAMTTPPALTYSVGANGRVTFTGANTPVLYLSGTNQGFLVGSTADVDFGIIEPQAAGPFNDASLSGAYLLGTEDASGATVTLDTGVVTADGMGNAPGTTDQSSSAGLAQNQAQALGYSIAANGTGNVGANTSAILISPNKLVFISNTSANPTITVVER